MASTRDALKRWWTHGVHGFRTFVLHDERPYAMGLLVGDKCNLGCFYCTSKNTGQYDMDCLTAFRLLQECYDTGCRTLFITGGEPMVWRDESCGATLGDVVAEARRLGFVEVIVFTNGTQPLDIVDCSWIVTVDGDRHKHNQIRHGTYDLLLQHVRQAAAPAVASITLSKANADELEETVKSIAATNAFKGISFNLLTHEPAIVEKFGLLGEARLDILDRLWRLKREGYPILLSRAAYKALRENDWKRPIKQIQFATRDRIFTCCRDVDHPEVCAQCGYSSCVEISQVLAGKPSAMLQVLRTV
jgi:MoaA/NifB/PqqE/SkfB family radical SAM enzyme